MTKDELHQRIVEHLASQSMCVISTCSGDIPRATPIEYYSEGLTLYMTVDPGVKVDNLRKNQRISIGVCNNIRPDWANGVDWASVRSAQITGVAKFLVEGTPEYKHALEVYKYWIFPKACGLDPEVINKGRIYIKVEPEKIEYMEFALKRRGYGSRQVLELTGH
jgi:nitroimidazol reductase NimA-like FMN-containing flavoprotein (pyridoxamine 5'-phosphate oxidase superfamily)